MSEEVVVALVGGLALVGGAVVTVLGSAMANREPRELRHAASLGGRLDAMAADSGERRLAADYHDDLIASWVIGRVTPSYTIWRDLANSLLSVGAVFFVGGAVAFVALLFANGVMESSSWATSVGLALVSVLAGVVAILVAVLVALAASRKLRREVDAVRGAYGLRESVAARQARALKRHRSTLRSDRHQPSADSAGSASIPNNNSVR